MVLYKSLNSEWTGQYLYTCYSTHQTLVVEWGASHSSWRWENCHTIWIFNCFLFWENKIHLLIPGFVCYCSPDLLARFLAPVVKDTWLRLKIPKHLLSWIAGFSIHGPNTNLSWTLHWRWVAWRIPKKGWNFVLHSKICCYPYNLTCPVRCFDRYMMSPSF